MKADKSGSGIATAVKLAGGQNYLATLLSSEAEEKPVTQQAVSLWVRQGFVPPNRALQVSRAVGWRVAPTELLAPELKQILLSMLSPAIAARAESTVS